MKVKCMLQIQKSRLNSMMDKISFKNLVRNETEAQCLKGLVALLTHIIDCACYVFSFQQLFKSQ